MGNGGPLKGLLLRLAGSRVNADNVLYALLSEKDFVLAEIERSRQRLDERFFSLDADDFVSDFNALLCGKALVDAAYFPAQLDFGFGFYGTAFTPRTGDMLRAVRDERYNFLIPYYRNRVLPALKEERPEVVGISMTCTFELIPAFTLAHMVKEVAPGTHVVLGGVLVTELADRIARNRPLWELFDSLVLGPGEVSFCELIERVGKGEGLAGVPNTIYKEDGSIKRSEAVHEFNINQACAPEFVSVRPKSGLALETTSSRYGASASSATTRSRGRSLWTPGTRRGACAIFSSYWRISGNSRRSTTRWRLDLPIPRCIRSAWRPLPKTTCADGRVVKFSALFRLEKEFKSKAFCRKLAEGGFLGGHVGLESGSPRVNAIINKGIDLADTDVIIRNFRDTGILLSVFTIIGTPGETEEDALMTYEFLRRWHKWLKLDWEVYPLYVLEQSPLAQRAVEFGLEVTPLPDDFLVESMGYRVAKGVSQERSMALSIGFSEKLNRFRHPLSRIMDVESYKSFLLAQAAKGVPPEKVRDTGLRL